MVAASDVEQRLRTELSPTHLEVRDVEGCGASFEVWIVSDSFQGKRILERHKMVNAALGSLMADGIHALSIKKAKTPEEEQAQ